MNKLTTEKRVQIIHLLVEGNSLRSTSRIVDCSINTITKLLVDIGKVCLDYHYHNVRGLKCVRVQADEIWSFVYCKERNTTDEMRSEGKGDAWTWVAIDADSKLVISWLVGDRGENSAVCFMRDLNSRLTNRVQLSTDGHKPYLDAVEDTFGGKADYAMMVKKLETSKEKGGDKKYSAKKVLSIEKRIVSGNPEEEHISTSFIERQNLTLRMSMRRFTRLTNAFSKKVENHCYALALHYMYYNFCRIHKSLRVTPAMEAGLTKDLWNISDLISLMDNRLLSITSA